MIKETTTWKHIRRSPYQSLAAVLIMMLTLFIASLFTLTSVGMNKVLKNVESKPQITAFFKDEADNQQIQDLKTELEKNDKVASVKFVSKDDALNIYKDQNKNDPILLELVTANILPSSLEISAKEAKYLADINDILKSKPGIEEIMYQREVVDSLVKWIGFIRTTGIIFVLFLTLISISIIMMVIGMKISVRREEIEILKLVGATNWYIRKPFIYEGILYGIIGAVFAWAMSYLMILYATPVLSSFLSDLSLLPVPPIIMIEILLAEVLFGVFIGFVGSFVAIRRYFR
jgi:cell division transport system permease protein